MTLLEKITTILSKHVPDSPDEDSISPPRTYFLELTNHCNLRCTMCNFHSPSVLQRRKKGFMSASLAMKALNEISAIAAQRPWVALHGAGEPLLHKDLVDILHKTSRLDLDIGFLTNVVLLDAEITKKLMDTPISWIGFSIDGIDREKFNKCRHGADYELVLKNALHFVECSRKNRPDIKITVNMTVQDEMRDDIPSFLKHWLRHVDEVSISPCRPIGTRNNPLVREFPAKSRIPCYMLSTMMVIYWNGDVGLCCEDWFNDGKMGSLVTDSIEEIWKGRRFSKCRALHKKGRFAGLKLCKDCNSWYNSLPQTFFDNELRCSVRRTAWQDTYLRGK